MAPPRERLYFWLFYPIQAAALLAVLVPFLRFNNLLEWDFPGHYAAVWHLKNHLFPWPAGWNPFFYCGYPQGLFYPPLAHYLAALLSFVTGVGPAIKALIAVSVMALPVSFYAFARRAGLDDLRAAVCSSWMTAFLFLSGEMFGTWSFGSDLRSILNVGLFANAVSLPILFAFFAACGTSINRRNWKWAASLLGLLLLLHPLTSLIAGLFFVSVSATQLWQSRGEYKVDWMPFLGTPVLALLLGATWVLPYVSFRALMNTEPVGAQWSPVVQLVLFNGLILALLSHPRKNLHPLIVTYAILTNFIILGTMWRMELQFTRLTIYLLFFIPVFFLTWVRSRTLVLATAALAAAVGFFGYRYSGIQPRGVPEFPMPDFGKVQGRILSVSPSGHLPSLHVNHDLIPIRTRNEATLGLFIEASLNGRFLGNLMRSLEPEAYVWGTPTEIVKPEFLGPDYAEYIRDRLRLFDIRYIYTDLKLEELLGPSFAQSRQYINSYPAPVAGTPEGRSILEKRFHLRGDMLDFHLYSVGPGALTEALPYVPKAPGTDWKSTNRRWFLDLRGVPVFTDHAAPGEARGAQPGEGAELVSKSENMDRLVLNIRSSQPVPVLVKVGYFPTWRLTLNGRPAPVYRASPNLILIFGQGQAVLEYRRPWQEYVGILISLLGIILLAFL